MSVQSFNITSLSPDGDDKPPKSVLFSELNQLVQETLHPELDTLFPALFSQLETYLQVLNNDQDIMRWVDIKNRLTRSESSIKQYFIDYLTRTENELSTRDEGILTLKLLDNAELDHKLAWLAATDNFENSTNSECIGRIKSCLESTYSLNEGTYPATPERICESFSSALESLHPDRDIEQQLFIWFASHLKKSADELWLKADQLLGNKGLVSKPPSPVQNSDKNRISSSDKTPTSIPRQPVHQQSACSDMESPHFLDDFADKLISRLEDMLAEDKLIPEARATRIKASDLANILSSLQLKVLEQQLSIRDLNNSVINALEIQGVNSKLSRHHEDLINMVGWLFVYILEDHNLPDDVKKIVALLQIPILKEAILDDAFLTEHEHPSRLLLNSLTSAGMQYCREPKQNKHVLLLIEHTVRTIISDHNENPDIFHDCLDGFQEHLNIILQPEPEDSENKSHFAENNEQPEKQQKAELNHEQTIDFQSEMHSKENTELDEEIILSSGQSESSPDDSSLSELSQKITEPHHGMVIDDPGEITDEQQSCYSSFGPVIIDELQPGQWVEFIGKGDSHRLRCKLSRLSKDCHRYIFVNRSGMRVAERSGRELRKEIDNGSISIVEENPIIDRAIQAVLDRFKKH